MRLTARKSLTVEAMVDQAVCDMLRDPMRIPLLSFALLALSACASTTGVVRATMPLEILRDEGGAPRMGDAVVQAGGYKQGEPFYFTIYFDTDGARLGDPHLVAWQMPLGSYCRNRFTAVESILTGPTGQSWPGRSLGVPMGPDRGADVTSGFRDKGAQDLMQAASAGGRFTLALQDNEGHRWNERVIDIPTPRQRQRLFASNRAAFAAADPAKVPVKSDLLEVVASPSFTAPWPARGCPTG